MDIVILLLVFTQSFPPIARYNTVQAALIGTIMRTYFKTKEVPMCLRRTTLIPNHIIRRGSRDKVTNLYYIPKIVHGHSNGGERSIWLHNPCLLRAPMVGRDQYGYITPAF